MGSMVPYEKRAPQPCRRPGPLQTAGAAPHAPCSGGKYPHAAVGAAPYSNTPGPASPPAAVSSCCMQTPVPTPQTQSCLTKELGSPQRHAHHSWGNPWRGCPLWGPSLLLTGSSTIQWLLCLACFPSSQQQPVTAVVPKVPFLKASGEPRAGASSSGVAAGSA